MGGFGPSIGRFFLLDPTAGTLSGIKKGLEKSADKVDENPNISTPEKPDQAKVEQQERDRLRRASAGKSKPVATSPLGLRNQNENIGQKTLLGQ